MGRVMKERTGPLRSGNLRGLSVGYDSKSFRVCTLVKSFPIWSREVPGNVWVDVWVEILSQVKSSSYVVSSSPVWTSTERTPSPFLDHS